MLELFLSRVKNWGITETPNEKYIRKETDWNV